MESRQFRRVTNGGRGRLGSGSKQGREGVDAAEEREVGRELTARAVCRWGARVFGEHAGGSQFGGSAACVRRGSSSEALLQPVALRESLEVALVSIETI